MTLALINQTEIQEAEWVTEWAAYRAEDKKKPLTPRALKMVKKWLSKYSEPEQERLIEHAIMNNWEGLHYVEPPKEASTRHRTLQEDLMDTSWSKL
jgi:hypothetical protein